MGFEIGGKEVDQASAALITDLKQRDMLKDTLVIFGSEFGRTSYSQGGISKKTGNYGREHHRDCFTFWIAGGGIKPGVSYGSTCEFGFRVAENPVSMHDFHATILHLLGIDHERFTYRYQGRDFRLTDVSGKVVQGILA
jgi:arylsulfatase A-like enzyme